VQELQSPCNAFPLRKGDDSQPGELIEYYCHRDVHFDAGLADVDFDPENAAYAFRD
jgi:hypothetical protein